MHKAAGMVSARRETPNFIIGANFLITHERDLWLLQKLFMIGEHHILCTPKCAGATGARLKSSQCTKLPSRIKMLVSCRAEKGVQYFAGQL